MWKGCRWRGLEGAEGRCFERVGCPLYGTFTVCMGTFRRPSHIINDASVLNPQNYTDGLVVNAIQNSSCKIVGILMWLDAQMVEAICAAIRVGRQCAKETARFLA